MRTMPPCVCDGCSFLTQHFGCQPSRRWCTATPLVLQVCPWSPITVEYNTIVSVKNFFDLMWKTKFVRQSIVDEYFEGCDADPGSVAVLRYDFEPAFS